MSSHFKKTQISATVILKSRVLGSLNTVEKEFKVYGFFIKQQLTQKSPLKQTLRSLLRSPHVNKNAQEHFHEQKITRILYLADVKLQQLPLLIHCLQISAHKTKDVGANVRVHYSEEKFYSNF
jgi:ribosomal protein S10